MYWIQSIENGPRRVNHAAGALDNLIYSFGGYSNAEDYTQVTPIDVHILNACTLKWYSLPKPDKTDPQYKETPFSRYGHTVVVYQQKFYLWGGRNDHPGTCNRLFCFNPKSCKWSIVPVTGRDIPSSRDGHSACVIDDRMYIFGGFEDSSQQFSDDLYCFDFNQSIWHLYNRKLDDQVPQWRDFHSATNLDGRMYIFGGRSDHIEPHITDNLYDNQLYVFNPESQTWLQVATAGQVPPGRRSHSAFAYDGKLYIFAGYNDVVGLHFNDLHEFNPLTSIWRRIKTAGIPNPIPRRRQCCLVVGHRMYMFGGTSPVTASLFLNNPEDVRDIPGNRLILYDQSDLYVLDFAPSLKTLCFLFLAQQRIDVHHLPKRFYHEYQLFTQSSINRARPAGETSG
ncbi:unnamed protein product [Adineta ricciae]|uniref:Kelch domain-containing protein 3 n=1 Tax=Adineta ricciae TaxID=249248 RepID=A0A814IRA7_ADIRI|nr:unnamed protein product [Adineta ricciae]CAF1589501.1 unnamed protein product [Adineta ricciae]